MSKNSWVGFPEVAEQTEGVITVGHTGMPQGMDPESLQLNVKALNRGVIGWGGYSALTLTAYKGEEDQVNFGISDADGSGAGLAAGSVSITKAESVKSTATSNEILNDIDIRNGVLNIQWNSSALASRLSPVQQYEPKNRARQLDRVIRSEGTRAIFQHNVANAFHDKDNEMKIVLGSLDALTYGTGGGVLAQGRLKDGAALLLLMVFMRSVAPPTVKRILSGGALKFGDSISDPFTLMARPTRAAIGAGVLGASRLVRATSTKVQ